MKPGPFCLFKKGRVFLFLLSVVTASIGHADAEKKGPPKPDQALFSFEERILPSMTLNNAEPGSFEEDASVRLVSRSFRLSLPPIIKTEKSFLISTIGFDQLDIDYENWDEARDPTTADHLYAIQWGLTHRRPMTKPEWSMTSFLTPSLNSDFKAITTRAIRLQAGVLFNRTKNQHTWSAGLVLINDYGRPRIFPALAFNGQLTEKQTLVVRLPVLISWNVELGKKWDSGLAARVSGNNFHIEEEGRYHDHTVRYSVTSFGPFLKYKISPRIFLTVDSGIAFRHHLEYWKDRERQRNLEFNSSEYLNVGIRMVR